MIYIFYGNDTKKKNAYLKKSFNLENVIIVSDLEQNKNIFFDYAGSVSLFGDTPVVVAENIIENKNFSFSKEEIILLSESNTKFIFLEDKLLSPTLKKYQKYAKIEDFSNSTTKKISKTNVFGISDAFACRDKINTWVLYRDAISTGVAPEEISGILFWKIKTMILNGDRLFSKEELKERSSSLVFIYHKAHLGEIDFTIGLEQFILSSLNK